MRGISNPRRKCLSTTTFLFFKQCSTLQSFGGLRNCIAVYVGETCEQSEWLQARLALHLGFSRGKALDNEIPQKVFFPVEVPCGYF